MAKDRVRREWSSLKVIGRPEVFGGPSAVQQIGAGDASLYLIDVACVSDDARPARLVTLQLAADAAFIAGLVASARAAGWTE